MDIKEKIESIQMKEEHSDYLLKAVQGGGRKKKKKNRNLLASIQEDAHS